MPLNSPKSNSTVFNKATKEKGLPAQVSGGKIKRDLQLGSEAGSLNFIRSNSAPPAESTVKEILDFVPSVRR
jgi:hypothetical protein